MCRRAKLFQLLASASSRMCVTCVMFNWHVSHEWMSATLSHIVVRSRLFHHKCQTHHINEKTTEQHIKSHDNAFNVRVTKNSWNFCLVSSSFFLCSYAWRFSFSLNESFPLTRLLAKHFGMWNLIDENSWMKIHTQPISPQKAAVELLSQHTLVCSFNMILTRNRVEGTEKKKFIHLFRKKVNSAASKWMKN